MTVYTSILFIIIGFVMLIKGADFLVDGASNVAKKFHIPEIVIGLTIISIGTSMPELIVSITSAVGGRSDMSLGNALGSNICNLLLILGVSTMIRRIDFKRETRLIEVPMSLVITIVFMLLCNLGQDISRVDAVILIVLFVMFIGYTVVMALKGEQFDKEDNNEEKEEKKDKENKKTTAVWLDIIYIILGIVILKIGGDLTVDNAVNVAEHFKLSEKIIGVTILAVGTSLPELVTSVSAAIKGKSDIAIGNILGSNIFNMLMIIGVSAMIKPFAYNMSYNKEMIILIVSTIVLTLFPLIPPKNKMSRRNGALYFGMYIAYVISLFI